MKHKRLILATIVTLGLALRVAWVLYSDFSPTYSDDAGHYEFLGRSLAAGAGFANLNGAATTFWPPGYPLFLAAIYKLYPGDLFGGPDVMVALLLNALLGTATILLVYGIGRRAFDERVAILGMMLTACFPSLIFLTSVTLSETLFTFLALLGVWLVIEAEYRPNRLLLVPAGIVVGLAALTRGQALLLPVVLLPFWWRALKGWRLALIRAVTVGALTVIVVLPWTVRNYVESKSFVLISTNAGVDFYIGHSAEATGQRRQVDDFTSGYENLPPSQAEAKISMDGFQQGLGYAWSHPLREIELSMRKLFYLYYNDHEALAWTEAHGESAVHAPDPEILVGCTVKRLLFHGSRSGRCWRRRMDVLASTSAAPSRIACRLLDAGSCRVLWRPAFPRADDARHLLMGSGRRLDCLAVVVGSRGKTNKAKGEHEYGRFMTNIAHHVRCPTGKRRHP